MKSPDDSHQAQQTAAAPRREHERVTVLYTNWKGKTRERVIQPLRIWFGHTDYHPEDQWLLEAIDCEDDTVKSFAQKDIKTWFPAITVPHHERT